jgi:hypothetical protein
VQSVQLLRHGTGLRIYVVAGGICFLQTVRAGAETHTASCSVGTGFVPQGKSGRGVKLTNHVLLVELRMNGAVPLVSLYAFMMWTGIDFYLPLQKNLHLQKSQWLL